MISLFAGSLNEMLIDKYHHNFPLDRFLDFSFRLSENSQTFHPLNDT